MQGPPAHSTAPVPAGWYPDPVDPSRFRQWTGIRWTHVVYDNDLARDGALIENLPRPNTFPAPEVPPAARILKWRWIVAAGAAVGLIALLLANIETTSSSSGSGRLVGISPPETNPSTTEDTSQRDCIDEALAADARLVERAVDESAGTTGLSVNHAWSELAKSLESIDLRTCPNDFTVDFVEYIRRVDTYGAYLEDRTGLAGLDDIFNGDDVEQRRREMLAQVNSAYDQLRIVSERLGIDAPRSRLVPSD